MARKLTSDELTIISELRKNGVFQEVDWELINLRNGICILACGDGDHFDDFYMWLRDGMEKKRIHVLSGNGGALVIPHDSPLNENQRGENLMEDIVRVQELKAIFTFVAYSHAPCEAADMKAISILDQISLLKRADEIIQKDEKLQTLCFFQVDYGKKERTYFVNGERWREYLYTKSLNL